MLIGRVISDSGLTSGKVFVYYIEIDSYTEYEKIIGLHPRSAIPEEYRLVLDI